jgi:hypothetical protein
MGGNDEGVDGDDIGAVGVTVEPRRALISMGDAGVRVEGAADAADEEVATATDFELGEGAGGDGDVGAISDPLALTVLSFAEVLSDLLREVLGGCGETGAGEEGDTDRLGVSGR